MRGAEVLDLQRVLHGLKFYTDKLDGAFGPNTDKGVRAYQKRYNLAVDGIVGPKSKARIESMIQELAHIIMRESGAESEKGQRAVGNVVLNRVNDGRWPDTVEEVIYQPFQFSPVNDLPHYKDDDPKTWQRCVPRAKECFYIKEVSDDTLYFSRGIADYMAPNPIQIGAHWFGKDIRDVVKSSGPVKLRIGTWNIKRGDESMAEYLERMGCRILCGQEGYGDLAYLKTPQMPCAQMAKTLITGGKPFGNFILSHYPMSAQEIIWLPDGGHERRLLQIVYMDIEGKRVAVFNTHFSYENAAVRAPQFAAVFDAFSKNTAEYKILCGDFNAKDKEFLLFRDYTWWMDGVIDKIITTKNINVPGMIYGDKGASDHRPVFADIELV
jgi:hypothetical protein